ncbi:MAG: hypothetical protein L0229_20545 [Blastocatellia bacterium]|nr:hypothetical protein [Blastocatellia bacterium]
MTLAAILFGVSALGGLTLAIMRFKGKELPPMGLAIVHGLVGAAGLVALILAVTGSDAPVQAKIALGGFVAAALGGFALFASHLRKQALSVPLVVVHGLVAVVAFVFLLLGIFAMSS